MDEINSSVASLIIVLYMKASSSVITYAFAVSGALVVDDGNQGINCG
jgi:hypothetical protein